jgi:hypothetical protein
LIQIYLWLLVIAICFVLPIALYRDRSALTSLNIVRICSGTVKIIILAIVQTVFFFLPLLAGSHYGQTLYPGAGDPVIYAILGISTGAIGLLLVTQLSRTIRVTMTASELKWTSVLILLIFAVFAINQFGVEMTYYFLSPALLFLIGIRIKNAVLVLLIGIVGVFPLVSASGIESVSMMFALLGITVPIYTLMTAVLFLSVPFIMHFASAFVRVN